MIAPELLSDLIGMIYDCAIEPNRWPDTLAAICRAMKCGSGSILLVDLDGSRHNIAHTWGLSSEWTKRYFDYANELTGFYERAFSRQGCLDGEPLILSHLMEKVGPHGLGVFGELTRPQGISDIMQTVVLRQSRRIALFATNRHEGAGALTDEELAITRLLVPHIKRAVTIIDILDMKTVEARTLAATLDSFTAGVVVVGDQGRILHANSAAHRMLSAREPITAVSGHLFVRNARSNEELANAISLARTDEGMIAGSGIGVPLRCDEPSVAHVLPLAYGDLRTRLIPQATAAVFITQAENFAPGDIGAFAANFSLTPAETRILEQLAGNATITEITKTIDISAATARTHLAHIFSKTGVSRQADLLTLVNRLVPPVRRPNN